MIAESKLDSAALAAAAKSSAESEFSMMLAMEITPLKRWKSVPAFGLCRNRVTV
ncbi:MAG: hypothetical protein R2748_05390 [Bryobacterales bacterium]